MIFVWIIVGLLVANWLRRYFRAKNAQPSFENKVVWITGASSGIGEEFAYKFSRLGASLIISARREAELQRVKANCTNPDKVTIVTLDFNNPDAVFEKVSKFMAEKDREVDILINNAGISMRVDFISNAFENDKIMINTNYLSHVAMTKAVLPSMLKKKSGHIVFINSLSGKMGIPFRTAYCASKHAITGFADALRAEVIDQGVHVTNICPGYIATNLSRNALTGEAGARFGKLDANIAKGMSPKDFVEKCTTSIYLKEKEVVIVGPVFLLAHFLRNIFPDLIFWAVWKRKFGELKKMQEAK